MMLPTFLTGQVQQRLLNAIELAAQELAAELPPAASAALLEDVRQGLADVAAYRLALIRLGLEDEVIERAVAAVNDLPAPIPSPSIGCRATSALRADRASDADEILTARPRWLGGSDPGATFATASGAVVAGD